MKTLSYLFVLALLIGGIIGAAAQDADVNRWIGIDVNEVAGEDYDIISIYYPAYNMPVPLTALREESAAHGF